MDDVPMRGRAGHVLVVGSLNADLVTRVPRLPRIGETILGESFAMHPGGKGANQAVAAARLGAPVRLVGRVGKDAFGTLLRDEVQRAGVDVASCALTRRLRPAQRRSSLTMTAATPLPLRRAPTHVSAPRMRVPLLPGRTSLW